MSGIRDLVESYYNAVYLEEKPRIPINSLNKPSTNTTRPGAVGYRKPIGSLPSSARQPTQYPDGVPTGVGGGNAGASTRSNRPAPVVRPLPAGAPDLKLKVISPAGAKVAPSAAPAAKPAGSAMDQWRAANPKLAAAADERDRTRGTSATTNPLMKDMKSSLPAPTSPSPTTAKTGFDLAKKGSDLPKK